MSDRPSYNRGKPFWTDEERERLRQLWAEGLSCSQISKEMPGRSRNAIIGCAHRMNLPMRTTGWTKVHEAHMPTWKVERKPKPKYTPRVPKTPKPPKLPRFKVVPPPELPMIEPGIHAVAFEDLTSKHCKYIVTPTDTSFWDIRYCGNEPMLGKSWCRACSERVFSPVYNASKKPIFVARWAA